MAGPVDRMLPWLGAAARDARERGGLLQVHIAAAAGRGQDVIGKFERGQRWPREPDSMISAYAEELKIDPLDIWTDALSRWRKATGE